MCIGTTRMATWMTHMKGSYSFGFARSFQSRQALPKLRSNLFGKIREINWVQLITIRHQQEPISPWKEDGGSVLTNSGKICSCPIRMWTSITKYKGIWKRPEHGTLSISTLEECMHRWQDPPKPIPITWIIIRIAAFSK
jgi:hypothetical protein